MGFEILSEQFPMENVFEPKKNAGERAGRIWNNRIVLLDGEGIRNEQTRIARREDVGVIRTSYIKKKTRSDTTKLHELSPIVTTALIPPPACGQADAPLLKCELQC